MFDESLSVQTLLMGHARTDTQIFCVLLGYNTTEFVDGLGPM